MNKTTFKIKILNDKFGELLNEVFIDKRFNGILYQEKCDTTCIKN